MDEDELTEAQRQRLSEDPSSRYVSMEDQESAGSSWLSDYEVPEWLQTAGRVAQEYGETFVPGLTRRAQAALESTISGESDVQARRRIAGDVQQGREERPGATRAGQALGLAAAVAVPAAAPLRGATTAARGIRAVGSRLTNPLGNLGMGAGSAVGRSVAGQAARQGGLLGARSGLEGGLAGLGTATGESFGEQYLEGAEMGAYSALFGGLLGGAAGRSAALRAARGEAVTELERVVTREHHRQNRVAAAELRAMGASPGEIRELQSALRSADAEAIMPGHNRLVYTAGLLRDADVFEHSGRTVASLRRRLRELAQGAGRRADEEVQALDAAQRSALDQGAADLVGANPQSRAYWQRVYDDYSAAGVSNSARDAYSNLAQDFASVNQGGDVVSNIGNYRDLRAMMTRLGDQSDFLNSSPSDTARAARHLWGALRTREADLLQSALGRDVGTEINALRAQQGAFLTSQRFGISQPASVVSQLNQNRFTLLGLGGSTMAAVAGQTGLLAGAALLTYGNHLFGQRLAAWGHRGAAGVGRRMEGLSREARDAFQELATNHPRMFGLMARQLEQEPETPGERLEQNIQAAQQGVTWLATLRETDPALADTFEAAARAQLAMEHEGGLVSDEEFDRYIRTGETPDQSEGQQELGDQPAGNISNEEFDRLMEGY